MKKFIFMMALLFSAVICANAQEAIETPKTLDNVYVTLQGGVSTPLNFNHMFPVNPQFGLAIGKQISPVFGVEAEGTTWLGSHIEIPVPELQARVTRFGQNENGNFNAFRGLYVGLNGTVNLTNLFLGYNGTPRSFELSAVAGTGWEHVFTPHQSDKSANGLGVKTGLDFAFNLGKAKAHTISFKPAVLWNVVTFGEMPLQFNKNHAQLYLGLGYTYHFKTSNGTHAFKVYDVGALNDEINYLRGALDECEKRPPMVVEKVVDNVVTVVTDNQWVVQFAQNSADLTSEAKTILDSIDKNVVVEVVGLASPEGDNGRNQKLSEKRASTVAEYLVRRGVGVKSSVGKGVEIGNSTNRLAIITAVK
jgi:hypothetical protein